jgi:hypothetical protein
MPLSPDIQAACLHASEQLKTDTPLFENTGKDRIPSSERDHIFFADFFKTAAECQNDIDFMKKLLDAAQDFQIEKRTLSATSTKINQIIQQFINRLAAHPLSSLMREYFNRITDPEANTSYNLEPKAKQCTEKYQIIISSYLNELKIIPDSSHSGLQKYTSSFSHAFSSSSSGEKTAKSETNPKVLLMKHMLFDLSMLLINGQYLMYDNNQKFKTFSLPDGASRETVLITIRQLLENREKYFNTSKNTSHFSNILALIKIDIQSELDTGKTLQQCPAITYAQIATGLSTHFNAEKKFIRKLEPSHLVNNNNSSASNLMNAIAREQQTFGGEDQKIVITSIRQNINQKAQTSYDKKKSALAQHKGLKCPVLESFSIEQEDSLLTPNEVLLFHGTKLLACAPIFHEGFEKPSRSYLSVAGSLGEGIYMSDSFVKSGTFSTCALCGAVNCSCQLYDNQKIEHCVIISKVVLGNVGTLTTKTRAIHAEYDTLIGVGKNKDSQSTFNSTEVCIKNPEQILPLFEVKYFTYENMLILEKWPTQNLELGPLRKLIETLLSETSGNQKTIIYTIKKECERLLQSGQLMKPVSIKVSNLIDQLNIEENQYTQKPIKLEQQQNFVM